MNEPNDDWINNPPESLAEKVMLLEAHASRVAEASAAGAILRDIFRDIKTFYNDAYQSIRAAEPIAFFKPSYEQALLLNCWVWGVNFPICFSANRIGKTVAFVINALLWIFPNNPQWAMFRPYVDHLGRLVAVLPRPKLSDLLTLQAYLEENPYLFGNPRLQPYESTNLPLYQELQRCNLLTACWPYPPIQRGGTFWLGAPDHEFHRSIIMRRWKDWLPVSSIIKWNTTDRIFSLSTSSTTNPKPTAHEIVCKSYESEDTKWSGDAVQGIVLTEGFDQATLDEIKQRIVNDGFMSWDYTPTEARNTGKKVALAYRVYKREEELPLRSYTFTKFSVRTAPTHIIPAEKRADLIRMWEGKEQGKARLEGDFYASSGLVLDKLNREFHCLNWSLRELFTKYPDGRFYRSIDPGLDHPTACCWGYLSYNNIWFIFRFYSERGKTIPERCKDIIRLSGNERQRYSSRSGQVFWREIHPRETSEVYVATVADYHVFKEDENTGLAYANNYITEGLSISPSTHMGPEERASVANQLLDPDAHPYLAHPDRDVPPSARIFFLTSQPGVAKALDSLEQIFWDRYKAGDMRGEPKDKVPTHGDDELDALCQLVCGPYVWTSYTPRRINPLESEPELILPATPRGRASQYNTPEPEVVGGFH